MPSVVRNIATFLALICAVVTSQIPEYAQQYRQRLGGAIDEIDRMLSNFDADAASSGLDRPGAIRQLRRDAGDLEQRQATRIEDAEVRLERLRQQVQDFANAGSVQRLLVLSREMDAGLAVRTLQDFEPAVPTTAESFVISSIGFVTAWVLFRAVAWPITRRRRVPKHRSATNTV